MSSAVKSLASLLLVSFVLIETALASPEIGPEVMKKVLAAVEQVDPARFKFDGLSAGEREQLVKGVLETIERRDSAKVPASDDSREETFRQTYSQLRESPHKSTPSVAGFSPNQLLALASIGREHCFENELEKRRKICTKLAGQPNYETFCKVAHERSVNWCKRPVSIASPFADLYENVSPEAKYSIYSAQMKLSALVQEINLLRLPYWRTLNWQKTETFDRVLDILKRVQNKEVPLTGKLSANDLLALTEIDKGRCSLDELERRAATCKPILSLSVSVFCTEAYERSLSWCRNLMPPNIELDRERNKGTKKAK